MVSDTQITMTQMTQPSGKTTGPKAGMLNKDDDDAEMNYLSPK
jgi:hypothetical protein